MKLTEKADRCYHLASLQIQEVVLHPTAEQMWKVLKLEKVEEVYFEVVLV
jgi:hypothetical protein